MRVFLAAHADRLAGIGIEQARFLKHPSATFGDGHLPGYLVFDRLLQKTERVQVLHFRAYAEFFRALQPYGDVGVAAQMALFHIAGGDADELQRLLHLGQIGDGLVGRAHVGFADDFYQRCAAAVEIDVGEPRGILKALVLALAGVVFHVDARHADAFGQTINHDIDYAVLGKRLIVLGDLVALGEVGIEVVLAREPGDRIDRAIEGQGSFNGQFDGIAA